MLIAAGINFGSAGEWLAGTPRTKTRNSLFAALMVRPSYASLNEYYNETAVKASDCVSLHD